jgi:hypothetical protein
MSHLSDAARKTYIALHHVGGAGTQFHSPAPYAAPYSGCATNGNRYDFAVNGNGVIAVGTRYRNPNGCHATTCNCEATGIVMLGCFGGCGGAGDIATASQKCAIAHIWKHLGIATEPEKLKPHRYCDQANPCNGNRLGTVCCGTRYTAHSPSSDYWSSAGLTLRNQIVNQARSQPTWPDCSP